MCLSGHNCNLCKKKTIIPQIGVICFGEKFRGKNIEKNNEICEEYEFGGFIDLAKEVLSIPNVDKL